MRGCPEFKYLYCISNADSVSVCCGEESEESNSLCSLVDLRSYPRLSWVVGRDWKNEIQAAEVSFLCRVAGLSLGDRERSWIISTVAAPPCLEEPAEVQASGQEFSWTTTWGGVSDTSNWVEVPGQTQNTLERFCLSAGLRTPWFSPGETGGGGRDMKIWACRSWRCLRHWNSDEWI